VFCGKERIPFLSVQATIYCDNKFLATAWQIAKTSCSNSLLNLQVAQEKKGVNTPNKVNPHGREGRGWGQTKGNSTAN